MEDLCNSAVKEEAIEVKLRAVAEQWAQEVFTFADHKQRGPVVLKVRWMPAQQCMPDDTGFCARLSGGYASLPAQLWPTPLVVALVPDLLLHLLFIQTVCVAPSGPLPGWTPPFAAV